MTRQVVATNPAKIDWVITGGESGHHARPSHPDWFRNLRDQCKAAEVPFHFKQWGQLRPCTEAELQAACGAVYVEAREGCGYGAYMHRVRDRQSVVWGRSVAVRVDLGGSRSINKKNNKQQIN